jgi:hypothetical protein
MTARPLFSLYFSGFTIRATIIQFEVLHHRRNNCIHTHSPPHGTHKLELTCSLAPPQVAPLPIGVAFVEDDVLVWCDHGVHTDIGKQGGMRTDRYR